MGAGEFEAGEGIAGEDPVEDADPPRNVLMPAAVKFDLGLKDFPRDDDGRFIAVHPVDQAVNLALGVVQGTIASVPGFGHRLRRIRHTGSTTLLREVEDAVRLALAERLAAGDVAIEKVEAESPVPGEPLVAVTYRNLRLVPASANTATLRLTTNGA